MDINSTNSLATPVLVFEGADGVGKTTQAATLVKELRALDLRVYFGSEPFGVPILKYFKSFLQRYFLSLGIKPQTRLKVFNAARKLHRRYLSLACFFINYDVIVLDRWDISTRAYQGHCENAGTIKPDADVNFYVYLRSSIVSSYWVPDFTTAAEVMGAYDRIFMRMEKSRYVRINSNDNTPMETALCIWCAVRPHWDLVPANIDRGSDSDILE